MRKFYQHEWFDIDFVTFTQPNPDKIADTNFYEKFYREFFKLYSSFNDLPESWRAQKEKVADIILHDTSQGATILSIGGGIGYVETILAANGRKTYLFEPSKSAIKWIDDNELIFVIDDFSKIEQIQEKFDYVFMNAAEYFMNDDELTNIIRSISKFVHKTFLLVSVSTYSDGYLIRALKDFILILCYHTGIKKKGQFWGYMRRPDELLAIFKQAGLKVVESGFLEKHTYFVKGNV